MNVEQARGFISAYAKFVEVNMVPVQQGNGVCISTPMLNRNNDCMRVYLGDDPSGGYVISDLGETINDLELSGFSMTGQRIDKLNSILSGFSVKEEEGELCITASAADLPMKMNMLLQAMASVDDMFLLSQSSVRNLFTEDVGNWLLDNEIPYVPGPSFQGRSGLSFKFDYAIGKNKRRPMRLIKTVNNPDKQGIQNALFGWEDIKSARNDYEGVVFLNSTNTKDGVVPPESIEACKNYGLTPIIWGVDQDSYVPMLAALPVGLDQCNLNNARGELAFNRFF